ncbi:divalent-cation tolerance protein CutA [Methanocaldococcus infernus]
MIIIYTTFPNMEKAKEVCKALLEKKLVGCVNLRDHLALYWWEGKIEEDEEIGAILKTRDELKDKVIEELKKLHPYSVPAIIWFKVNANDEYLDWLKKVTE